MNCIICHQSLKMSTATAVCCDFEYFIYSDKSDITKKFMNSSFVRWYFVDGIFERAIYFEITKQKKIRHSLSFNPSYDITQDSLEKLIAFQ